jgi:hypothetical protein
MGCGGATNISLDCPHRVITVPTTPRGLTAMLTYLREMAPADDPNFWSKSGLSETLIETLAAAAKALIGRQQP